MKFLFALSLCAFATAAQAAATLADFEGYSVGDTVGNIGGLGGIDFNPVGVVEAEGAAGNYLFLAPAGGFAVPTEQASPEYATLLSGGQGSSVFSSILSLDVMSTTGGSMFFGFGGHNVAVLSAGEWYHFDVSTSHSIKFHSDGGISLDNILFAQTITALPEPSGWVTMLLGFGAIGVSLRRRKGTEPTLAPVRLC